MPKYQRSRFAGDASILLASAAAIAASLALAGCESALSNDYDARGMAGDRSVNMLVAKAAYEGTYSGEMVQAPTIPGGVNEVSRVDSPGPATAVTPVPTTSPESLDATSTIPTGPATPATSYTTEPSASTQPNPIEENANDVGLEASMLNEKEPIFNMSLQDAIARALKNALSIKVEGYNPAIKQAELIQAEAAFDPVIFGTSQYSFTHEPQLEAGSITNGTTFQNQIGIRKLLPTGGTASISGGDTFRDIHDWTNATTANPTPANTAFFKNSHTADLNFTLTQPLLRGFGAEVSEATIYADRRDYRISLATFRRQVITTVANVEEAYHDLVLARTLVDIQEQLVAAAEDTERRVWDRRLIDADKVSVNQAVAAVHLHRAELVGFRENLRNASDKLKNLINDPEISIRDNALINPTDKPIIEPIVVSTRESIETALRQRTELQEARLSIEKADIAIDVAKNDLLPKLDLTVSVQTNGLDPDLHGALDNAFATDFVDYTAGVKFEIPFGDRQAEGELKQRHREREQLLTQLLQAAQQVVLDVKTQLREVLARYQEIQAREMARKSAEDELRAIIDKEAIVNLTPEFLQLKLDSESNLAQAEQNLIQSIVSYDIGIMKLEQAKGTLLEYDRISLDRPPVENDDDNAIRFMGQTYKVK